MSWGLLSERIRKDRIKISIAAWAYENGHRPIMSDAAYDALSNTVHSHRNIATGHHRYDRFFQRNFTSDTSLWIHKHPDQKALANIYARYYQRKRR